MRPKIQWVQRLDGQKLGEGTVVLYEVKCKTTGQKDRIKAVASRCAGTSKVISTRMSQRFGLKMQFEEEGVLGGKGKASGAAPRTRQLPTRKAT